jgi:hypothetical protein
MGPQKRLNQYLKSIADRSFCWGQHDCLTFTNEAWRQMHGEGWADDWLGRYMVKTQYGFRPMRKPELLAEFPFTSFTEAIDTKLTRVDHVPPRGALVAVAQDLAIGVGLGLGICVGIKAAFLSRKGVIYMPVTTTEKAWL